MPADPPEQGSSSPARPPEEWSWYLDPAGRKWWSRDRSDEFFYEDEGAGWTRFRSPSTQHWWWSHVSGRWFYESDALGAARGLDAPQGGCARSVLDIHDQARGMRPEGSHPAAFKDFVRAGAGSGQGPASRDRSGRRVPEAHGAPALELLGERQQAASGWQYVLRDEERRCFAGLLRSALSHAMLQSFQRELEALPWEQPLCTGGLLPRKTLWMTSSPCACNYRYGGVEVEPHAFQGSMHRIMEACMPLCGLDVKEWPNSCNLNLYEDGKSAVSWHADDEALFQGRFRDCRIVSLSLGQDRTFELRRNGVDVLPEGQLLLRSGDLMTMEGLTQKHYKHRIVKGNGSGRRINLTWRWIVKHREMCPLR